MRRSRRAARRRMQRRGARHGGPQTGDGAGAVRGGGRAGGGAPGGAARASALQRENAEAAVAFAPGGARRRRRGATTTPNVCYAAASSTHARASIATRQARCAAGSGARGWSEAAVARGGGGALRCCDLRLLPRCGGEARPAMRPACCPDMLGGRVRTAASSPPVAFARRWRCSARAGAAAPAGAPVAAARAADANLAGDVTLGSGVGRS